MLQTDHETVALVESQTAQSSDPETWLSASTWLSESREEAMRSVYTSEVLEPVTIAMRGLVERVDRVEVGQLPDAYFQNAGRVARVRATQAGYRLAGVLSDDIASFAQTGN